MSFTAGRMPTGCTPTGAAAPAGWNSPTTAFMRCRKKIFKRCGVCWKNRRKGNGTNGCCVDESGKSFAGAGRLGAAADGLALRKKARGWVAAGLVVLSGLFCALALYLQICYQNHLVEIGDIIAILDTAGPLVLVAGVLLA